MGGRTGKGHAERRRAQKLLDARRRRGGGGGGGGGKVSDAPALRSGDGGGGAGRREERRDGRDRDHMFGGGGGGGGGAFESRAGSGSGVKVVRFPVYLCTRPVSEAEINNATTPEQLPPGRWIEPGGIPCVMDTTGNFQIKHMAAQVGVYLLAPDDGNCPARVSVQQDPAIKAAYREGVRVSLISAQPPGNGTFRPHVCSLSGKTEFMMQELVDAVDVVPGVPAAMLGDYQGRALGRQPKAAYAMVVAPAQ